MAQHGVMPTLSSATHQALAKLKATPLSEKRSSFLSEAYDDKLDFTAPPNVLFYTTSLYTLAGRKSALIQDKLGSGFWVGERLGVWREDGSLPSSIWTSTGPAAMIKIATSLANISNTTPNEIISFTEHRLGNQSLNPQFSTRTQSTNLQASTSSSATARLASDIPSPFCFPNRSINEDRSHSPTPGGSFEGGEEDVEVNRDLVGQLDQEFDFHLDSEYVDPVQPDALMPSLAGGEGLREILPEDNDNLDVTARPGPSSKTPLDGPVLPSSATDRTLSSSPAPGITNGSAHRIERTRCARCIDLDQPCTPSPKSKANGQKSICDECAKAARRCSLRDPAWYSDGYQFWVVWDAAMELGKGEEAVEGTGLDEYSIEGLQQSMWAEIMDILVLNRGLAWFATSDQLKAANVKMVKRGYSRLKK